MDWNWFFSAVAQSSAAIVGIFGAFIITKIVNNQAELSRKRVVAEDLMLRALRLVDEANHIYFHWYNERITEEEMDSLSEDIGDAEELNSPESYLEQRNFSPFVPRKETVEKIRQILEAKRQRRTAKSVLNKSLLTDGRLMRQQMFQSLRPKLESERTRIDQLLVAIRDHGRQITNFVNSARRNPESSTLISFSIAAGIALFFCGVVYPLSFLPLEAGQPIHLSLSSFWDILMSLKGGILTAISTIFSAIMIVFMITNTRLKFGAAELNELERYEDIGAYSKYFHVLQANDVETSESKQD